MTDRLPRGSSLLAAPLVALALALAAPSALLAQQGAVTGQVTDAQNGQPVTGAQVFVVGGQAGTLTGEDGSYRLTGLPTGNQQIRVQVIGYQNQTRTVQVQSGQSTTANFQLDVSAVSLQDVVVTATGERQQRELGNAISTVNAAEQVENTQPADFTGLLSGSSTGVTIQRSSGSLGTASTIKIRGTSSLGLSTTPIIYVDGARINNDNEIDPGVGGQDFSRLNDLNPQDIENIEIIKGPAAATLYGTEASAGVIRITTKAGTDQDTRYTFRTSQGVSFDNTNWWSMAWNPQRGLGPFLGLGSAAKDTTYVQSLLEGTRYGDPFRKGHTQNYGASARGGGGGFSYYLSGQVERNNGSLPNNKVDSWNARANVSVDPGENMDIQFSSSYVSAFRELPDNDNSLYSVVGNALGSPWWGPMSVNGTETCMVANELARGGGDLQTISDQVCAPDNPYFVGTFDKIFTRFNEQQVERFIGSSTFTWRPFQNLRNRATVGYDHAMGSIRQIVPVDPERPFSSQSEGFITQTDRNSRNITLDATSTLTLPITDMLSSQTTLGFQWYDDVTDLSYVEGRQFPAGSPAVGNSVSNTADDAFTETKTLGVFLQEQFSWANKLYVTPGVRLDDNSAFGENLGLEEYFQANASYVLSEEDWFPTLFDQFKARVAWGQSAKQPGSTDALALLDAGAVTRSGQNVPGASASQPGNPDLRPETGEEWEAGFDASLFDDRLGVQFTYYDKTTKNAIVQRPLAPSVGVPGERFVNVAEIANSGIELSLNGQLVEREDFRWSLNGTLTTNDNEITELEEPIIFGSQRHREGFPAAAYFAEAVNLENGSPVVADTASFQGNPVPTFEGSLATNFRFFDHVTLFAQGAYAGGHALENGTESFNCGLFGGGGYFGSCVAMFKETPTGDRADEALVKSEAAAFGTEAPFIYDADYIKLRTVTLRFQLPQRWLAGIGLRQASLSLTGENLATWTAYQGTDPEVNVAGSDQFGRSQFIGLPAGRRFITSLQIGL